MQLDSWMLDDLGDGLCAASHLISKDEELFSAVARRMESGRWAAAQWKKVPRGFVTGMFSARF